MSSNTNLKEEVERFIYHEMRLLDERKYQEWLDLFSDDGVYWIPRWVSEYKTVENPDYDLNILYLDKKRLEAYVRRILTGMAYAYEPHARTTRLVSNIMLGEVTQDYIQAFCKFIMVMFRAQPHELYGPRMQEIISGDIEYKLKRVDGKGFKIKMKKATMINETIIGGELYLI